MVATISPATLAELRRKGEKLTLIDVRTPAEFGAVHVDFAHNMPLDRLDAAGVAAIAGDGPVYVVCKSGGRSRKACEQLLAAGIRDAISVEGGTLACEAAGVPVVRGRPMMSLERQVRIAAGALVATGAALGAFGPAEPVNWQAIGLGLAGFVGCGLVFAGVTDTCGMAMLIARMPWNQASGNATGSATACSRAVLFAVACAGLAGVAAAEHTKDSLDMVKQALREERAVIIDVREPDEWAEGHLADASPLPLSALERGVGREALARLLPEGKVVYCYCLAGGRCAEAAALLTSLGYDARAIKPGYPQLVKAGFPVAFGK